MRTKVLTIVALGLVAGACQTSAPNGQPYMGGPDNVGEANRLTYAAQIIDPAPEYDNAVPETSAEHAAQAVDRYRTDKVKKPDRVKTTDAGASGSGSN